LKNLVLLIFIFSIFSTQAKDKKSNLLHCLGKEELSLHNSRRTGPHYLLNQKFINEASSAGEFKLKEKYFKEICITKEFPPSIGLLKNLLIRETEIFKKVFSKSPSFLALYKANYESLVDRAPLILFEFLALIQSQTPYPHCLKENIPQLEQFMSKFQYLQEELEPRELIKNKKLISKIFMKLKYLEAIYEACDKKQKVLIKKVKTKN